MAAGATYEPIASQTLGSAAASVTFSSIPQGYTDLVFVMTGITSTNENNYMRYNSDSSSLYSSTYVGGDGSTASSGRASNQNKIGLDGPAFWTSSQRNQKIIQIQNYSNATTFKTNLTRSSSTVGADASVGLYRSTSAITSVTFLTDVTYSTGSTFTLYGIAAA
jgi:hypothetical protein